MQSLRVPVLYAFDFHTPLLFLAVQASVKENVLRDYRTMGKVVKHPELQQYPKNGRGRGECRDGALQALTTNSSKIYSEEICNECNITE